MVVDEVQSFLNINQLLVELKGLVLKTSLVSPSLITLELLTQKFSLLESTIQKRVGKVSST